jgi:hypothetical protein
MYCAILPLIFLNIWDNQFIIFYKDAGLKTSYPSFSLEEKEAKACPEPASILAYEGRIAAYSAALMPI